MIYFRFGLAWPLHVNGFRFSISLPVVFISRVQDVKLKFVSLCHILLNIPVGKEATKSKYILKFGYRSFRYKFIHSRCK